MRYYWVNETKMNENEIIEFAKNNIKEFYTKNLFDKKLNRLYSNIKIGGKPLDAAENIKNYDNMKTYSEYFEKSRNEFADFIIGNNIELAIRSLDMTGYPVLYIIPDDTKYMMNDKYVSEEEIIEEAKKVLKTHYMKNDFDDKLNELYQKCEIHDQSYLPSEILKKCNSAMYEKMYNDEVETYTSDVLGFNEIENAIICLQDSGYIIKKVGE